MNTDNIPAWASAIALVIHAIASGAVQIIRAWKQPVTIARPQGSGVQPTGPAAPGPATTKGNIP